MLLENSFGDDWVREGKLSWYFILAQYINRQELSDHDEYEARQLRSVSHCGV